MIVGSFYIPILPRVQGGGVLSHVNPDTIEPEAPRP